MAQWVRELDYLTTHTSLSPIRRGFAPGFVNYEKECTRLASDTVYQLLAHGRWFSPGTPASSTTKTCCLDIAEISLKVALNTKKSNQSIKYFTLVLDEKYIWAVSDTILCDKVCQWLAAGWWFSLGTLVSSTNKTDCHDVTEIVLKVALNTITLTL